MSSCKLPSIASSSKKKGKSNHDVDFVRRSSTTPDLPILIYDSDDLDEDMGDEDDVEIIAPLRAATAGTFRDRQHLSTCPHYSIFSYAAEEEKEDPSRTGGGMH